MNHKYCKYSHYLMFYLQLLLSQYKVNSTTLINAFIKANRIYFILFSI